MTSSPAIRDQRSSFTHRFSNLFETRRGQSQTVESSRNTTTFEVPLYLSPTRYEPPASNMNGYFNQADLHSRQPTRSMAEDEEPISEPARPFTVPSSSRYSTPRSSLDMGQHPPHPNPTLSSVSSSRSSGSRSAGQDPAKRVRHRSKKRSRSAVIRYQMRNLTKLGIIFGVTLFITSITYLVLAVTGIGRGVMFHVLMVLLILGLTGVFAHSAIRLMFLSKKVKRKRMLRQRNDGEPWERDQQAERSYFGDYATAKPIHSDEELGMEKPIRITTAEDEEAALEQRPGANFVRQPPPVYGYFRSSKRLNPDLVHWQKIPPSPLTPTYDEAISDVHRVMGYRPPSYIESESGTTRIVEPSRGHVNRAMSDVHPLERERVAHLARDNMI